MICKSDEVYILSKIVTQEDVNELYDNTYFIEDL